MVDNVRTHKFKAETRKVLNILTHSLYTNREIFLRELLSNASDALDKLRFLQNKGESVRAGDLPLEIRISVDKEKGLLQIADTGLGMTEKELIDNLGTIAKSGSERFAREMGEAGGKTPEGASPQDAPDEALAARLIGRFGVGFYSVFMAADAVEVISVPAQGDEAPHVWTSDGGGGFSVRPPEGEEAALCSRGTVIRAKIKADAKEFLEKYRLESIIRKHSNFLSFPIFLEGERINTTPALWREPKFSITPEQYHEFYKYLTYDETPPLDTIHLSVDAPVQFNALIFIPATAQDLFSHQQERWGPDLYASRVLIERGNKELLPQYLGFLKGMVDTEDLPLNISRETLQENTVLRKISQTVVKQILGHLEKMALEDKDKYASFWKLHGKYFKFVFNDYLNREKAAPLLRFASSYAEGGFVGLDEYAGRVKPEQKDIWHLAAPSLEAAKVNPHLSRFRRKGLEVLYLLEPVDEFALESLGKYKDLTFKSVERAEAKDLEPFADAVEEEPSAVQALTDSEKADLGQLVEKIRATLGEQIKEVRLSDRLAGSPAVLVSPDGLSSSMEKLLKVMQKDEAVTPKILEINPEHSLLRALLRIYRHDAENPLISELVRGLFDNVLLLDGCVNDAGLMADRSLRLMDKALSWYADLLKI
ncbi:MAG: molecular chaperone HtpG [Desulfovibrionaceae bacterium]|nr:molecular chaperone HtpG [Desulfovibrionaceae bacterium]